MTKNKILLDGREKLKERYNIREIKEKERKRERGRDEVCLCACVYDREKERERQSCEENFD